MIVLVLRQSKLQFLLVMWWWITTAGVNGQQRQRQRQQQQDEQRTYEMGYIECPCIMDSNDVPPMQPQDYETALFNTTIGYDNVNSTTYGIGCAKHDIATPQCTNFTTATGANFNNKRDCSEERQNLIPPPLGCDDSWCQSSWCFVSSNNCSLAHRKHRLFDYSNRYYSYATCGDVDSYTSNRRFGSLDGQVFKVGFNSNTGGWRGAQHSENKHFRGPIEKWSGLAVAMIVKAAAQGRFFLQLTEPPDFLVPRSADYFNSDSPFDLCVYATSLGYLDLCIAQYTITDQRAPSADWLMLGSSNVYLVVDTEYTSIGTLDFFLESVGTIFQPFTKTTWAFIIFFVIPVLGSLMVVHERGRRGSSYPREEVVLVTNETTGEAELQKIPIPLYRSIFKSTYIATLAVLQQSYEQSVLTLGAKLNLLGISFFILTIIAVYTANLAAILTQNQMHTTIQNFDDAVRAGYRFCSERKNMETILSRYPNMNANERFTADPIEFGGDGKPGYSCDNCLSRQRVFDYMDPILAKTDSRYCHAAVALDEDLEVMHAAGLHCNKTLVDPIHIIQHGIPIFEQTSPILMSYFLQFINSGHLDEAARETRPNNLCPAVPVGEEGSALSMAQLSGIWVVAFGLAAAGLVVTFIQNCYKKQLQNEADVTVRPVHKWDQTGGKIDAIGIEDSWMTAETDQDETKPILVHQDFTAAGTVRLLQPDNESRLNINDQPTVLDLPRILLKQKSNNSYSDDNNSNGDKNSNGDGTGIRYRPRGSKGSTHSADTEKSVASAGSRRSPVVGSRGIIIDGPTGIVGSAASPIESRERLLQIIEEEARMDAELSKNNLSSHEEMA